MKKTITIIISFSLISLIFFLSSCGNNGITGRWEHEEYGQLAYFLEFTSNGKFEYGSGPQGSGASSTGTYTVDSDGTLHIIQNSSDEIVLKKATVDEMAKMDSSESNNFYAYDESVLYFRDSTYTYKKK